MCGYAIIRTMDYLAALLGFLTSFIVTTLFVVSSFVSGVLSDEQKITILPPVAVLEPTSTSSSQSIIGTTSTAKPAPAKTPSTTATQIMPKIPAPTPLPTPTISPEDLNTQTRAALVNILCRSGGTVGPISGSGVFVDSRGIVLTNAHIGQYFLLKDYPTKDNVECTVRTGSPASPRYKAMLLYLPPAWVTKNATQLVAEQAKGTGENDYAFLLITEPVGQIVLPALFPNVPITITEPNTNDGTFLAAYPAGFLDGMNIERNLYPTSAYATVKELFTFSTGSDIDLVSIGGTVVSQGGSSGGGVVRTTDGKLQGIIATATEGSTTSERDLRAITVAHIERSLIAQGQGGIVALFSQNLLQAAQRFASTTALSEKEALIKAIERR